MRYLSVCSGIEAATVAWHSLGWKATAYSEIEPFPSSVLAHHYPDIQNVGDMTKFKEWNLGAIDLLVGGTPCQSFSVAGLRKGIEDPRGNLTLTYCGILDRFKPKWFVWENVPGVLSSRQGRDFGSFLGALVQLGYGFAYRVLDAQYFGVAQRRRRVFVVGCLGDWRSAAEVLFERESLSGNPAPCREKGQEIAGTIAARFGISRKNHEECVIANRTSASGKQTIGTLMANAGTKLWLGNQEALSGDYHILEPVALAENTIGRQPQNGGNGDGFTVGGPMYTLNCTGVHGVAHPIAFPANLSGTQCATSENLSPSLVAKNPTAVAGVMAVRRLTPIECERLQGFTDNYTNIPWRKSAESPDGPRYKALGNSMAVPVMKWIGQRIKIINELKKGGNNDF